MAVGVNCTAATARNSTQDESSTDDQTSVLEAYVVRWVPTRVLCYCRIVERIAKFLPEESELRGICIGAGCGSESLALQSTLPRQCTINYVIR